MNPLTPLLEELSTHFPDSWVNDQGWRLSGLPHSRLWLKVDIGYNQSWPSKGTPATWDIVRIDIKEAQSRHADTHVTTLGNFKDAADAAEKVQAAVDEWILKSDMA